MQNVCVLAPALQVLNLCDKYTIKKIQFSLPTLFAAAIILTHIMLKNLE